VTVGFYAPLPPARTGVADYAAALLAELRKSGSVDVAPAVCDVALYHVGNNGLHAAIYRRALEVPGVVVLHDAVLHHFLLGQLDEGAYAEEFVYNYGEWNRGLAHELWRGRASSGSDRRYFDYPMLRRIAERSRAVVVHNPAAARMVTEHAAGARVVEIPHLFAGSREGSGMAEALRWRQRQGIDAATFLFAVFGYLRESKRLMAVLEAFGAVHGDFPRTALLIAGEFVSSDLERAAAPLLAAPGVFRCPHLDESEWWRAATAVDACINLRYPAAGETSGIAIRAMGIGKAVMVTESLECARFPEDACLRIVAGAGERDSLREHMRLVAGMPEVAAAVGERAAAHIAENHAIARVAAQYWDVLRECA
jgi:glycosyltransferase involved in cell wall biosynthesis